LINILACAASPDPGTCFEAVRKSRDHFFAHFWPPLPSCDHFSLLKQGQHSWSVIFSDPLPLTDHVISEQPLKVIVLSRHPTSNYSQIHFLSKLQLSKPFIKDKKKKFIRRYLWIFLPKLDIYNNNNKIDWRGNLTNWYTPFVLIFCS